MKFIRSPIGQAPHQTVASAVTLITNSIPIGVTRERVKRRERGSIYQ